MRKDLITAMYMAERIITEASDPARDLFHQSRFGVLVDNRVQLSLIEAYYLIEKERLLLQDGKGKGISTELFLKKVQKADPAFWIKYCVFKDIRNRGYIIKTALKFGADFRVYDRGVNP